MIIIGEKINGFIPRTLKAIEDRDGAYIRELAEKQTAYGSDFIDVCAGTAPYTERETLKWLIDIVQSSVDTPLSIDSLSVDVILNMLPYVNKAGLINSVSNEPGKCEAVFSAIADTDWKIIILTSDSNGIPAEAKGKYYIAKNIIKKAESYGISSDRLFIDPIVSSLGSTGDSLIVFNEAVKMIRADYPEVHITSGLSNISYGMPCRKSLNTQFLALAMAVGMDSAIMDPLSSEMRSTMYATNALLGNDEYCMEFISAYRDGRIGDIKKTGN